ncbi:hypothetical protein DTO027I6_9899 [Penicillium roqueforti]|nr:hypothetical protein CBS147337_9993 [Penicillium roqueforti]KAI3184984.1 hypothetical protein DTO027I6_9899 [Penicillium roqueforti]
MSQDTDLASSSFHGSYGPDLFPSDLESSQQTIESTPASELLHPMISSSLERFGNDWIVYSEMSKEDFIFWWLQTIPGNELLERNKSFWDRSRSHSEAWNSFKQVAHTVTGDPKIFRGLAVFINASPQRRDTFRSLQIEGSKLLPIQDVKTRWNSTFLMLRRAKRLQLVFNKYCSENQYAQFTLDRDEWRQIDYLLCLTQPFFQFTTILCQTKEVTIHIVFEIYHTLFGHLEKSIHQLQQKRVPWKQSMLFAILAGKEKLAAYYGSTTKAHGDLYAIGTILAPQHKLQFFSRDEWAENNFASRERYRQSLKVYVRPYHERMSNSQAFSNSQASLDQGSQLATLIAQVGSNRKPLPRHNNEVENCLESGTTSIDPCSFWKGHQHEFPMLASVARDVLSIPATGAGVERLLGSARDICHYRRGSLKPTTIRDLVMYMCATKFDLGEEGLETFRQSFSREERETAEEEKDVQHPQENLDPISDDEEDPRIESREVEINAHVATGLNSGREQLDLLQGSSSEGEEV